MFNPPKFGSSSFGAAPNTFGATTSTPGGTFGQPQGSIFGQTTPGFGQPQQQTTSLFGQQQPQQQQTSLFGQPSTSTFGQPTPTTGGFGAGGGMFGQTSAFGGSPSLFGGTAAQPKPAFATGTAFGMGQPIVGTTVKFNPVQGTDTMLKNGISTQINTKNQCITCMKEYENKSLEELRFEDYQAGRKGGGQAGATPGASLFGQTAPAVSQATGVFGAPSTSAFGQPSTGFNQSSSSLFSAQKQPPFGTTTPAFGTSGAFNKPGGFGASTSTFTSPFTSQPQQQQSPFGFGANTTGSFAQPGFGSQPNTATVKPLTAPTTTATNTLFGATQPFSQSSNLFSGPKPAFGPTTTTSTTSFSFNTQPASTSTFSFNPPTQTTGSTLFGPQPQTGATGGLFGQSKPPFSFQTTNTTSTLSMPQTSTSFGPSGGLFGQLGSSTFNTGGTGLFGQQPSSSSLFPSSFPQQQQTSPLTSLSASSPSQNSEMLASRYLILPYGESSLTSPTSSTESRKLTADLKTLFHDRTTPSLPKLGPMYSERNSSLLFDGLDDDKSDENRTALEVFVPRRNIKKLVLKPKNPVDGWASPVESHRDTSNYNMDKQQGENIISNTTAPDVTVDEWRMGQRSSTSPRIPNSTGDTPKSNPSMSGMRGVRSFDSENPPEDIIEDHEARPLRCGVICTRRDYFTVPSLEELDSYYDEANDTCILDSFTVGRIDYGSIFWKGPLDVKGLNIDEIVHIRRKEVIVYPDDETKPPVGTGLNKTAQITLDKCYPIDKATKEPIRDVNRLMAMKYSDVVENRTNKQGATFKDYRPETGTWVFTVKHFSKYGLEADDDDESVMDAQQAATAQPKQGSQMPPPPMPSHFPHPSQKEMDISTSPRSRQFILTDNEMRSLAPPQTSYEGTHVPYSFHAPIPEGFEYPSYFRSQLDEIISPEQDDMRKLFYDEDDDEETDEEDWKPDQEFPSKIQKTGVIRGVTYPFKSKEPDHKSMIERPMIKIRNINLEQNTLAARNKYVCDISSLGFYARPKVRFFNGSRKFLTIEGNRVLIHESNYVPTDSASAKRLDERFQAQLDSSELNQQSMDSLPFIETKKVSLNPHSPQNFEQLVKALYGELNEQLPYARRHERFNNVLQWLANVNKNHPALSDGFEKIIYWLAANDLKQATNEAVRMKCFDLGLLIATGLSLEKIKLIAQLQSWRDSQADEFIEMGILKVYSLLAGLTIWHTSSGATVEPLQGLVWTQKLALMLLYTTVGSDGNEGQPLMQYFLSQLEGSTDDAEYHMLANHSPWISLSCVSDLTDEWFLQESLRSFDALQNQLHGSKSDMLHCLFASQLMSINIKWAVFVALHISDCFIRKQVVKDILLANVDSLLFDRELSNWLQRNLSIPKALLSSLKAIGEKSLHKHESRANYLLEARNWSEAHDVLVEYVFPKLVINDKIEKLSAYLNQLKPHQKYISNWPSGGGQIFQHYVDCLQKGTVAENFSVTRLRCKTKEQRLCQSEMARRYNLLYNQVNETYPLSARTPVPEDYAMLEAQSNASRLLSALCL